MGPESSISEKALLKGMTLFQRDFLMNLWARTEGPSGEKTSKKCSKTIILLEV
jgi:hypothetical protein